MAGIRVGWLVSVTLAAIGCGTTASDPLHPSTSPASSSLASKPEAPPPPAASTATPTASASSQEQEPAPGSAKVKPVPARQFSLSWSHGCALLTDGGVSCWGGRYGSTPLRIPGIDDAIAVDTYGDEVAIVRKGGALVIAGSPEPGFAKLRDVQTIASDMYNRCVIRADGGVYCGLTPDGSASPKSRPRAIPGVRGATSLAVGRTHACAVVAKGRVLCWQNVSARGARPAWRIPDLEGAASLSVAAEVGCAGLADNSVWCFSLRNRKQKPLWAGPADAFQMADDYDGTPFPYLCRANGKRGECQGLSFGADKLALTKAFLSATTADPIVQIHGRPRPRNLCLLDDKGILRCLGDNQKLMLAATPPGYSETPRAITQLPPIQSVRAGFGVTCGLSHSDVWCWQGRSWRKQDKLGRATRLLAGDGHLCAFGSSGEATCGSVSSSGEGFRNIMRVPLLDGARDAVLTSDDAGGVIAAISEQGELMLGTTASEGSLAGMTLKPIGGIGDAKRVVRENVNTMLREANLWVLDGRNRVYKVATKDNVATGKPRRVAEVDGTIALAQEFMLKANGELWQRSLNGLRKVRERSPLVSLIEGGACGLSSDARLLCLDLLPAVPEQPADRVLFREVAAASSDSIRSARSRTVYVVDRQGALHCLGNVGAKPCLRTERGITSSDELRVIPLR